MKLIHFRQSKRITIFLQQAKSAQFLQSWFWAQFQKSLHKKVFVIGIKNKQGKIKASAVIIVQKIFNFTYLYCPRGPVFWQANKQIVNFLFTKIKKIAQAEKAIFLRLEPVNNKIIEQLNVSPVLPIQPQKTIILDLGLPTEELLKNMKQKTRYNIRLAEKRGVMIKKLSAQNWPEVWPIMLETKNRDYFSLHAQEYYQKLLLQPEVELFGAEYQGKIIAIALVSFWNKTATYLHGGSSNQYRNIMAPYLLQWEIIQEAQRQGCQYYDFYGIDEKKWPGVTRFKLGFQGKIIEYPGTFDLIYNSGYYRIYKILRKARRFIKKMF